MMVLHGYCGTIFKRLGFFFIIVIKKKGGENIETPSQSIQLATKF
jgi:hypothetical protein